MRARKLYLIDLQGLIDFTLWAPFALRDPDHRGATVPADAFPLLCIVVETGAAPGPPVCHE